MNIHIRNAQPDDVPSLVDVFYTTWLATYPNAEFGITEDDIHDHYKDSYDPERIEKRKKKITELPENERYIVAEADGKVVGLCRAVIHEDKNQLQAIYVLPEFQGKGIGQMLWNEIKKSFKSKKPSVVEVATYNARAIAFYTKLGFTKTGNIFTEDRHRMKSGNTIPETVLVMNPFVK